MTGRPTCLLFAALLATACAPPTRARGAGDAGTGDAAPLADGSAAPDAASADAASPPPALGPVLPGPALDGVDRTRAPSCPASTRWAIGIVGRVLDERGAPRSGVLAQTCLVLHGGRNVCLMPSRTAEDGVFTIALGDTLRCIEESALRVLEPGQRTATAYAVAPAQPEDGVLFASRDLVMITTTAAASLPALGDPASARTIVFPGVELTLVPDALEDGVYEGLAARALTGAETESVAFLGDGERLTEVVALGPEARIDPTLRPSLRLTHTGLAPGTAATLLVLGGLYTTNADGTTMQEGLWHPLAEVVVDADGAIETPPGAGLTALGWIGVRAR